MASGVAILFAAGFESLHRLLLDPAIDVRPREPPAPAHLEGRDLLGSRQPVDRPLRDFQVVGDLLDGEDLAVFAAGRHRIGQSSSNLDTIVKNIQDDNDNKLGVTVLSSGFLNNETSVIDQLEDSQNEEGHGRLMPINGRIKLRLERRVFDRFPGSQKNSAEAELKGVNAKLVLQSFLPQQRY